MSMALILNWFELRQAEPILLVVGYAFFMSRKNKFADLV